MLTAWRGVTGMVVYWDLAALVNGAADYLLLLSAARLAGRTVPRAALPWCRPRLPAGAGIQAGRPGPNDDATDAGGVP